MEEPPPSLLAHHTAPEQRCAWHRMARKTIFTILQKYVCSLAYVHVLPYSRAPVPLACSCVSQGGITTSWPTACTSLCKCRCSFRISAYIFLYISTCAPWRMCMYFHIQGRLFPWRVCVFLKARITTSWPTACTSLHKYMCSFRVSACVPFV